MSRVGNRILTIPNGTNVKIDGTKVEVSGVHGTLTKVFSPLITISVEDNKLYTKRANEEKHTKQLHGTTNSLISGMITGVTQGFLKVLEIKGVGYKASLLGDNKLELLVGYSHPIVLDIPEGVKVELPKPVIVNVFSIDKQKVGEFAAVIRKQRKPNAYSGKGISYKGEVIKLKEGKAASK